MDSNKESRRSKHEDKSQARTAVSPQINEKKAGNKKKRKNSGTFVEERHSKKIELTPIAFHQLTCNEYYKHAAIKRISFNEKQTLLAVARTNGDLELWSTISELPQNWIPIKRIPAQAHTTIEAIVWKRDTLNEGYEHLFTAGLHGFITDWNLDTLLPRNTSEVLGGAIWDMCTSDKSEYLATACEDGKIRLYDTNFVLFKYFGPSKSDPIPATKNLRHCKGNRLLAITFDSSGSRLIVGGLTGVYSFDVKTASMQYRIILDNGICWCLKYISDDTLVVGDSAGTVRFCDGKFGTVLKSFFKHDGDVLHIDAGDQDASVFSCGVDGKVNLFQRNTDGTKGSTWIHSEGKRPSYHDLHALAVHRDTNAVITGGVDARLTVTPLSSFFSAHKKGKTNRKDKTYFNTIPSGHPIAHFSPEVSLLTLWNGQNDVNLFYIPHLKRNVSADGLKLGDRVPFEKSPKHLCKIQTISKGGWTLTSVAMSRQAKWIACAAVDQIILYRIELDFEQDNVPTSASVHHTFDLTTLVSPGSLVAFGGSADKYLLVTDRKGELVQVVDLEVRKLLAEIKLNRSEDSAGFSGNAVHDMIANERWLVVAHGQNLNVHDLKQKDYHIHWSIDISHLGANPYRLAFTDNHTFYVLLAGSENVVGIYSAPDKRTVGVKSFSHVNFDKEEMSLEGGIRAIIPCPNKRTTFLFMTHKFLFAYDVAKNKTEIKVSENIAIKRDGMDSFGSLLDLLKLDDNEAILLRHSWEDFMLSLPGVCYRHRFGV